MYVGGQFQNDNLMGLSPQFIRDSLEERFISMGLMTSTRLDVNPQGTDQVA